MTRHIWIPDTQVRSGVPLNHIDAAAKAVVDYKPDHVIVGGDWWDFASLNTHSEKGSTELEGKRYQDDLDAGNEAFERFAKPIEKEQKRLAQGRRKRWNLGKHFLRGNHEDRADRVARNDPKWQGVIGSHNCQTRDFQVFPFLELLLLDGITYSHFFQSTHSHRAIGGSIPSMLNRIGRSFVMGHVQGFAYGAVPYPGNLRRHGLVAGSFYQHCEGYRGPQGRDEWRGIVVLNEVRDGDYCIMPLTLDYLLRRYQ
jgi:hypothetical protein